MEPTQNNQQQSSGNNMFLIGGIIVFLLILAGVAYAYFTKNQTMPSVSSGAGGAGGSGEGVTGTKTTAKLRVNDYVSGEAINKRQLSNYAPYVDLSFTADDRKKTDAPTKARISQYDAYWGKIDSLFGDAANNEPYVTGFMKGMNLALKHDLVAIFKDQIQEYLNNDAKLPHWEVTTKGQFLK